MHGVQNLGKFIAAGTGLMSAELVTYSTTPTGQEVEVIVKIIVQIAIGICTVIGVLRRPRKRTNLPSKP